MTSYWFLGVLLLVVGIQFSYSDVNIAYDAEKVPSEYVPIKWAEIVLGEFDYYRNPPGGNAIQKVEHWIQSRGIPYDIIEDDNLEAPTDTPSHGKYPLQYSNGTIRYQVVIIITNSALESSAVNTDIIYWAIGNGTNAIIFGAAAKFVPKLLSIEPSDVSYIVDFAITQINCTIHKTFNDGIIEYKEGTVQTINFTYYDHSDVSNVAGKTLWYTMQSNTGKSWNGMINTTYGYGKVFWNTLIPSSTAFLWHSTFSVQWESRNLKFIGHAINFMFQAVTKIDLGLQGYKKWKGAITYRLDQDDPIGIYKQPEDALKAGWYVDVVICPLGYYANGGELTEGAPTNYIGVPNSNVKYGMWSNLVISTEPYRPTSRTFIVYCSSAEGIYDRVKVDWNTNQNFTDDPESKIWENMTSDITGLMGTYYWRYIDDWKNPTKCGLAWWCPLGERISDFSWWKERGQDGYIHYGLHSFQHARLGCPSEVEGAFAYWNGSRFIMNQTWIEQKFTEAKEEMAYCLGDAGNGFDADKVLVSQAGNEYKVEVDKALFNLDWVYLTYGDNTKDEPGWFLYDDGKPAMTCGGGVGRPQLAWSFEALKDAVTTLFPIFGIYEHDEGYYNLTFDVYPPDTAYTDMFCFAHLDESFEFWYNARYMWMNTINAYYENNKITLEYRANNTLKDYVWKFPIEINGKYFNSFSDNRTVGRIKHIDGKYIYIEFNEGGNEKIEVTYGDNPHIHQVSKYIENITQIYTAKNLRLQFRNNTGTINVKVNCTRLQQPNIVKANGTTINFNYEPDTKICSFNITFNGLEIVDILWEKAPPDSPRLISPNPTERLDPNKPIVFTWEFNDPDYGDSQHAYQFQLSQDYMFTSTLIDTGKVTSSQSQTTQKLPNNVGLYYWRVKTWDGQNMEGEWSPPQPLIIDSFTISLKGTTDNRTDIGTYVIVYFRVIREFDGALFSEAKGTIYINNMPAAWDETNKYWKINITQNSVGEWSYEVSNITDTEFHITTINNAIEEQKIIWDKLTITITPDSTMVPAGAETHFEVKATYTYDGDSVTNFSVNILRNGTHFAIATKNYTDMSDTPCTYQYTIESAKEDTYGLTAFSSNSLTVTWTPKPFTQLILEWIASNALILVAVIQTIIVITFVAVHERRKSRNNSKE